MKRSNKRSGGVILFINTEIKSKINDKMSMIVDNEMEIITVETLNEKSKKIIGCVYQSPGSNTELLTKSRSLLK